jgi:hypothetical protein
MSCFLTFYTHLLLEFGDDDIAALVDHFKPVLTESGIAVCDIEVEWTTLKTEIYKWSVKYNYFFLKHEIY